MLYFDYQEDRVKHGSKNYIDMLEKESAKEALRQSAKDKTLFSVVQVWQFKTKITFDYFFQFYEIKY